MRPHNFAVVTSAPCIRYEASHNTRGMHLRFSSEDEAFRREVAAWLADEGLSDAFIDYMSSWKGFIAD